MVARQEEFDGGGTVEEALEHAVVEMLAALVAAAGGLQKRLLVLDTVVVDRRAGGFFVGVEEEQHQAAWAHDAQQLRDGVFEHGRDKKLQGVPDERAVEGLVGKRQRLFDETLGITRGLLVFHEIGAEALLHGADNVIRGNAVPETGDEGDVRLARAGHVENRKSFGRAQETAELIESAAVARQSRRSVLRS